MAFFAYPSQDVPVTNEEFNLFHTIDRKLFIRLVFSLGRDPAESAQVMALWMWMEHHGKEFNIVYKTLMTLPNTLLSAMADESVLALTCIQRDEFPYAHADITPEIPMLQAMSKTGITLRFFHENRLGITRGVTQMFNDVCLKVFQDLLVQPNNNVPQVWTSEMSSSRGNYHRYLRDPYDLDVQRQILNKEMEEVLSHLNLSDEDDGDKNDQEVDANQRTIFLTFSKGYPISENEIREFFTRKNGDIIDAIYMQEVVSDQQPLFARLVVRTPSDIPLVLDGKTKPKFSINGKHLWARKYVRKTTQPSSS